MEEFTIKSKHNSDEFLEIHNILWELKSKRLYVNLRTHSIYAAFIFFLAFVTWYFEQTQNPLIFISIFYLLFLGISFTNILKSKRDYKKKIKKISERLELEEFEYSFEFKDESLNYSDNEKTMNFNWSMFAHYIEYKGLLILYLRDFEIINHVFKLENEPDGEKIMRIIDSKLKKMDF